MSRPDFTRMPVLDTFKAIACLLIVLHHMAAYGPMSDVAYPLFPGLIDWLYQYGRMAVQIFFVISGFLVARKFAPNGMPLVANPGTAIAQRYLRLAIPYLAALTLAIVCAALAREWSNHESIPDSPSIPQLLAHALLLQDLLGEDALSAGVWYIAIDFQLFALSVILFWVSARLGARFEKLKPIAPFLIATLTLASLFGFNRDATWDTTAFYHFGSYGLGMLSYWASNQRDRKRWLALLVVLVSAALLLEFRYRIAVAGVFMLVLALQSRGLQNWGIPRPLNFLGKISFSIFLVHFPLLIIVNTLFFVFFPQQPIANLLGLILAIGVSILGGALFYKWVESRPLTSNMQFLLPAGFLASGLLAASGIS